MAEHKYKLHYFKGDAIQLTQQEAWDILRFFWPSTNVRPGTLTEMDRAFAQGLIVEAIDKSYHFGFTLILYKVFGKGIAPDFKKIAKMVVKFCAKALLHWFKYATKQDLRKPKIFESVRRDLARNFKSSWKIREQGGDLTY